MWMIDVEAESHVEAAMKAQEAQRDPDTLAMIYQVINHDGQGAVIDLDPALRH